MLWVSALAHPNLFGTKDFVIVGAAAAFFLTSRLVATYGLVTSEHRSA